MPFSIADILAGSEAVREAQQQAWQRDRSAGIRSLGLCEAEHLVLWPGDLYRFVQLAGCATCAQLARAAEVPHA